MSKIKKFVSLFLVFCCIISTITTAQFVHASGSQSDYLLSGPIAQFTDYSQYYILTDSNGNAYDIKTNGEISTKNNAKINKISILASKTGLSNDTWYTHTVKDGLSTTNTDFEINLGKLYNIGYRCFVFKINNYTFKTFGLKGQSSVKAKASGTSCLSNLTNHTYGNSFGLSGISLSTTSTSSHTIGLVCGYIINTNTNTIKQSIYVNTSGSTYSLKGTINNALKFGQLPCGKYKLVINLAMGNSNGIYILNAIEKSFTVSYPSAELEYDLFGDKEIVENGSLSINQTIKSVNGKITYLDVYLKPKNDITDSRAKIPLGSGSLNSTSYTISGTLNAKTLSLYLGVTYNMYLSYTVTGNSGYESVSDTVCLASIKIIHSTPSLSITWGDIGNNNYIAKGIDADIASHIWINNSTTGKITKIEGAIVSSSDITTYLASTSQSVSQNRAVTLSSDSFNFNRDLNFSKLKVGKYYLGVRITATNGSKQSTTTFNKYFEVADPNTNVFASIHKNDYETAIILQELEDCLNDYLNEQMPPDYCGDILITSENKESRDFNGVNIYEFLYNWYTEHLWDYHKTLDKWKVSASNPNTAELTKRAALDAWMQDVYGENGLEKFWGGINDFADIFYLELTDFNNTIKSACKQVFYGNYCEDVTITGTATQITLSLFGLDVITDIRDISYDVTHWEFTWSHAGQTFVDFIALAPIVGSVKFIDDYAPFLKKSDLINDLPKNAAEVNALENQLSAYVKALKKDNKLVTVAHDTDFWARAAAHSGTTNAVVLGKINTDGIDYVDVAKNKLKFGYYHLPDDVWNELNNILDEDGMWEINQAYLDYCIDANVTFYFSHDPIKYRTYTFGQELTYLESKGYSISTTKHSNGYYYATKKGD